VEQIYFHLSDAAGAHKPAFLYHLHYVVLIWLASLVVPGEIVSNHDELMCNFFAQADALAYGKVSFFKSHHLVKHFL
jgi:hypothetical protein